MKPSPLLWFRLGGGCTYWGCGGYGYCGGGYPCGGYPPYPCGAGYPGGGYASLSVNKYYIQLIQTQSCLRQENIPKIKYVSSKASQGL